MALSFQHKDFCDELWGQLLALHHADRQAVCVDVLAGTSARHTSSSEDSDEDDDADDALEQAYQTNSGEYRPGSPLMRSPSEEGQGVIVLSSVECPALPPLEVENLTQLADVVTSVAGARVETTNRLEFISRSSTLNMCEAFWDQLAQCNGMGALLAMFRSW